VDIQQELIQIAQMNRSENGFAGISFQEGCLSGIEGLYDAVIMNPPYHKQKQFLSSPNEILKIANMEGDVKLTDWIYNGHRVLKNKGRISIIHKSELLEEILYLLHKHNFGGICTYPFFSRREDAFAKRIVITAVKNSKKPSRLFSGVVLHEGENYTREIRKILWGEVRK
jgi:tRNA1(Val) A37 N6-methylase TrmN6